jgi:hypothetical protein
VDRALEFLGGAGFAGGRVEWERIAYNHFTCFSIPVPQRVLFRARK